MPPKAQHISGHTAGSLLRTAARKLSTPGNLEVVSTGRRGSRVREFTGPCTFTLTDPRARLPVVLGRKLNPWVSLAEFPWLICGRNDLAWLRYYLPRADEFSDDGETWRAGYGPRLRRWGTPAGSMDQLHALVDRLATRPSTRRAVISLWDPANDNQDGSKDYPCTNWLHFQRRHDGALDLHVAMRSNDLWWGFSGVNVVNFTLLQCLVASVLEWGVGHYYHTASNLHLYSRHWQAAQWLWGGEVYDVAGLHPMRVLTSGATPLQRLSAFTLQCKDAMAWLTELRTADDWTYSLEEVSAIIAAPPKAWVTQWAYFMSLYRAVKAARGLTGKGADWWLGWWAGALRKLNDASLRVAALEYLSREQPGPLKYASPDALSELVATTLIDRPAVLGNRWANDLVRQAEVAHA